MKTNGMKKFFFPLLLLLLISAGILASSTVSLANDDDKGNDNKAKSFTVQDSDPEHFVKKGGISNDHLVNTSFPVYVFITNNGQVQPVSVSYNVDVKLTLNGPKSKQDFLLTILKGDTYGTLNISCPDSGTYTLSVEGKLDGKDSEPEPWTFTIGSTPGSGLFIEPDHSSIPVHGTEHLKARLLIPELHIDWDVTSLVWWSSDNENIASAGNFIWPNWDPGLVTGVSPGTTTIRASFWFGMFTGSAVVEVSQPSIELIPLSARINVGIPFQFQATYTDGISPDPIDLTKDAGAVWTTSNPLNPVTLGLVTPMDSGTTTITVTYQGLSKSATLTLVQPILTLSGTKTKINVGESTPFQASYTDATHENQDVTTVVDWTSGNSGIANIGLHTGVAQGVGAGTAVLQATYGTVEATISLTVVQPSLTVHLDKTRVNTGTTVTGKALYTDAYHDSGQDVTPSADWLSSDTNVAKITAKGTVQALSAGTANIQAQYNGLNAASQLTVVQPKLTLAPDHAVLGIGASVVLQANYTDADNVTPLNVPSAEVTWNSSNSAVAGVSLGTVSGLTPGSAVISALYLGVRAEAPVTVVNLQSIQLSIEPLTAAVEVGGTVQFSTYLIDGEGNKTNVTNDATWSSSGSGVTLSSSGLATGVSVNPLPVTITATFNGISGSAALTVSTGGVIWEAEERP
ncbi:MAG: Ig-like domain-containing protein [Desulfitobacteriaceae bacterium]|nr:Ig-like domain-containing protein [Desulfitobacteriaceae bacterium]MDI6878032.1 Ig-like domain-containing protein [Desulfitobacteriaceae bacterium]MDI6914203.1 Ig-like domain-containing protein [Desulfitobacteriaceae bacterium]